MKQGTGREQTLSTDFHYLRACVQDQKPVPQAKTPGQASWSPSQKDWRCVLVCVVPWQWQSPKNCLSDCYCPLAPRNTSIPWLLEPGDEVSSGLKLQKSGHQTCVKPSLQEILVLWSVAEGKCKDDIRQGKIKNRWHPAVLAKQRKSMKVVPTSASIPREYPIRPCASSNCIKNSK